MEADGRTWLADVGFGGDGLVEPIAFEDGASVRSGPWEWRLGGVPARPPGHPGRRGRRRSAAVQGGRGLSSGRRPRGPGRDPTMLSAAGAPTPAGFACTGRAARSARRPPAPTRRCGPGS
uniref:arylamine N-acetyltransferase n=1 Tax=Nonomuraea phyllanthi TaxID=2219224 RepID=UPI001D029984|nr:arylamine N-acetyltransferase [Nonomuraea phyllanthi]